MIFMAGPRQAGKSTLAREIASSFLNHRTFNWDTLPDKSILLQNPDFFDQGPWESNATPLIVFDEFHKYRKWQNYMKGVYDGFSSRFKFLVLGSGRLDVYRKGGDSLAGRYFLFYLWPLTIAELGGRSRPFDQFLNQPLESPKSDAALEEAWGQLSQLSGFPEPFTSGDRQTYMRWWTTYRSQLLREDVRDMTHIRDINALEILFALLPTKTGSPLSIESLSRDLQTSAATVKNWIEIFETYFLAFRIRPWSRKITRSLTKEKKLYLYNYAAIESEAAKFENMVALELRRAVASWNAIGYGEFALYYVRNKQKEEVDFLITNREKPVLLVEAKLNDVEPTKSLRKFQNILSVPAVQLVQTRGVQKYYFNGQHTILVASAPTWLAGLP